MNRIKVPIGSGSAVPLLANPRRILKQCFVPLEDVMVKNNLDLLFPDVDGDRILRVLPRHPQRQYGN